MGVGVGGINPVAWMTMAAVPADNDAFVGYGLLGFSRALPNRVIVVM